MLNQVRYSADSALMQRSGVQKCPFKRETLELYFQILLPVYLFNLQVQKADSNISEIIILLTTVIYSLECVGCMGFFEMRKMRHLKLFVSCYPNINHRRI